MRDLLVVGGGPAGLSTALHAARAGLDVTVRERRAGVIDKACGEGLMPGAVAALGDLGVDPVGQDLAGIRYVAGPRSATADFRAGPGRGVRRTELHESLLKRVADVGTAVEDRTVESVRVSDDGVWVDGDRFRYAVAADGLHSPVRRALGLDGPAARKRYGLRRHYRLAPWTSYVEVHWADEIEAYVTPVAPDLVGIAMLTSRHGTFADHLSRFPALLQRLRTAVPAGDVLGAGPLHQRARSRVAGRVLLVGDAGGYVDALTGEGVALAVAQAKAAVAAISAGAPERYERDWVRLTRRYRWLTGALLGATRLGPVRRAIVPAAERLPGAFAATVDQLARPA